MAGNVTGFQRPFTFRANATQTTVGVDQAVVYGSAMREVEVPEQDNLLPIGVVTYQFEDRDGGTVAVQLDSIAEIEAGEAIAFGDEIIVGIGGVAKKAISAQDPAAPGTITANILGEAQNTVAVGQKVQVLIRPRAKTV